MSHGPTERIPEDGVAAILARAAELDRSTRETVGREALRAAAIEAGISPAAVDRALEEYAAGRIGMAKRARARAATASGAPSPSRWKRFLRKVARPLKHGVLALGVGVFVASLGAGAEPLLVLGWIGWVAFAARLALRERPSRRAGGFLLSVALMTLGAISGLALAEANDAVFPVLLFTGIALQVVGTLVIKIGRTGAPRVTERLTAG